MVDPLLGYWLPSNGRRLPYRHPTSRGVHLDRGLEAGAGGGDFSVGCLFGGGLNGGKTQVVIEF